MADNTNIPPESGRRPTFDQHTGEVHGSGMGAGGGQRDEDFDSDEAGGDGYPQTGGEDTDHVAGSKGPQSPGT